MARAVLFVSTRLVASYGSHPHRLRLESRSDGGQIRNMDGVPSYHRSLGERLTDLWQRGVRLATRLAIAFGLAVAAGIGLGAAVADNGFVQILVTMLAALGFWLPFAFLVARVERFFARRRAPRPKADATATPSIADGPAQEEWRRLAAVAPRQSERLAVLQRSIERSRLALGKADLDPDAHDLCVLIDRRLPELIHRELDTLPPDDRNRRRQIDELVGLIEQFARHCSRRRSSDSSETRHEAAALRRRFEDHLTGPGTLSRLE